MKIARYTIDGKEWGPLPVLRPLPEGGDIWGCLGDLRGTPFESLISVIPGAVLSEALHGNPFPLLRVIGPPPAGLLRQVPKDLRGCATAKGCLLHDPKKCHPNPKVPSCYASPAGDAATLVVLTWVEGCYVVIIGEGEFSLG